MTPFRISIITLLCISVTNGSCQRLNDNYCDKAPYHSCYFADASAFCQSDQDCMNADGKVCDISSGTCVQCTPTKLAACGGTFPTCGVNNMCTICSEHTQCASNVCTPEGSCAMENTVAYVAPDGLGTECAKNNPCGALSDAIAKYRTYIKISKGLLRANNIQLRNQNITLLADPGARIIAAEDTVGRVAIFDVFNSSSLHIYDLEISNSRASGIYVNSEVIQGQKYNLLLVRASIDTNSEYGIDIARGIIQVQKSIIFGNRNSGIHIVNGELAVEESAIFSNAGIGIELSGGSSLLLTRSSIFTNENGGISSPASGATSGSFNISNNFIFRNGNPTSNVGGLSFSNSSGILKFNTIVDNIVSSISSGNSAGIFCNLSINLNSSSNNIVFRNQTGTNFISQASSNCNLSSSLNLVLDIDSINIRPQDVIHFAQPETLPYDYHLTSISPKMGRNAVIDAAYDCSGVDFDGDTRPSTGCDLGADEFKP